MRRAIVDAGPLVAFLDRAEQHHPWVIERIDEQLPPLLVWMTHMEKTQVYLRKEELDALRKVANPACAAWR